MYEDDEDDEEVAATEIFKAMWLEPVATGSDLPTEGIRDGVRCFVQNEDANYVFLDHKWFRVGSPPSDG